MTRLCEPVLFSVRDGEEELLLALEYLSGDGRTDARTQVGGETMLKVLWEVLVYFDRGAVVEAT